MLYCETPTLPKPLPRKAAVDVTAAAQNTVKCSLGRLACAFQSLCFAQILPKHRSNYSCPVPCHWNVLSGPHPLLHANANCYIRRISFPVNQIYYRTRYLRNLAEDILRVCTLIRPTGLQTLSR